MVQLTSRNRVNRRQHSPQRRRKPGAGQLLQRITPHLEFLEGRCLPSTVMNLNDSGAGSLRQAIIDTPAGGTVDFQAGLSGTITLQTGELLINKDVTIAGPGASVMTVSGNDTSRVFDIGAKIAVNVLGLTITGGSAVNANGGGIFSAGALSVVHCLLVGNSASGEYTTGNGSGIYNDGGTLNITSSDLVDNSGSGLVGGGGISNRSGAVTVTGTTFRENSATDGGGIDNENGGTLTVSNSIFSGNSASDAGGAILTFRGTVTITGSVFSGNSAKGNVGGAIVNGSGTATISTSSFTDNYAKGNGGAVYNEFSGTAILAVAECTFNGNSTAGFSGAIENRGDLNVTGSMFNDNSAVVDAGAIGSRLARLTIISNSTLSNNHAGSSGGAIYVDAAGSLMVTSSTLNGNSAMDGGGIRNDSNGMARIHDTIVGGNAARSGPNLAGPFVSLGHNLIGDGTGGSGYNTSDLVGTAENPIDPRLGPFQDNGGPTQTMALLPGSPAIDAGDNTGVPQWDQRGPDFPRIVNRATDIGAYEVQSIERPIQGPFDAFSLPPCDHCSSPETPLGFTFDFFGRSFNSVWVNNNGTISFDGAFSDFVPGPLAQTGRAVLAPFWADVLTASPGAGEVTYGRAMLDGDPAFAATWHDVTSANPSEFENYFQVVLIDHADRGFQEVQFNYVTVRWDQAGSSDQAPRVGYNNGAGVSGELPGSGTFDSLLDSGSNALQVVRRYTLIVYPFTVAGDFTGDFVHFTSSGSGNQPASIDLVPFGAIDHRAAMTNRQDAVSEMPSVDGSARFNDTTLPMNLPQRGVATASDSTSILDLILADDRLLL